MGLLVMRQKIERTSTAERSEDVLQCDKRDRRSHRHVIFFQCVTSAKQHMYVSTLFFTWNGRSYESCHSRVAFSLHVSTFITRSALLLYLALILDNGV